MHYQNVVGAFFDNTWAIVPDAMPKLVRVVNNWAVGLKMDKEVAAEIAAGRPRKVEAVSGGVAVIPVFGIISQRLNMMQEISEGGTSTEMLGLAIDRAVADPAIDAIVLNVDSPGGSVYGVEEVADKIYKAREQKTIIAVANSLAASAGYWIAAAAGQFYVTPSGEAGSIGVFGMHVDWSKYNEAMGVMPTYISAGKYKVEGNPDAPLADEARQAIQASVDSYYDSFTGAVAKFRGKSQREVKSGFGEGRTVRAKEAAEFGMSDGVKSFEQVLSELTRGGRPTAKRSASGFKEKRDLLQKHGG